MVEQGAGRFPDQLPAGYRQFLRITAIAATMPSTWCVTASKSINSAMIALPSEDEIRLTRALDIEGDHVRAALMPG